MEALELYVQPRYLLFEIPFIVSLIIFMGQVGGDADQDHAVDHDVDNGVSYGALHDVEETSDTGHDTNPVARVLSALGLGKVPISFAISTFLFLWSFFGWVTLHVIERIIPADWISAVSAIAVASVVSVVGTNRLASLLARYIPRLETYGISTGDLVGRVGTVRFRITHDFGSVQVYDQRGSFHEVEARVPDGGAEIPSGSEVYLMGYDPERRVYFALTPVQYQQFLHS